jgi:hypothetical protein
VSHEKMTAQPLDKGLLIYAFLNAGWRYRRRARRRECPLSPLLSNLVLDELDLELKQRGQERPININAHINTDINISNRVLNYSVIAGRPCGAVPVNLEKGD